LSVSLVRSRLSLNVSWKVVMYKVKQPTLQEYLVQRTFVLCAISFLYLNKIYSKRFGRFRPRGFHPGGFILWALSTQGIDPRVIDRMGHV